VRDATLSRPRLLDPVSDTLRVRLSSWYTQETCTLCIRRFVIFHGKWHPRRLTARYLADFLSFLFTNKHAAAAAQNQALVAILFLYRRVVETGSTGWMRWYAGCGGAMFLA
jgi:hypothetical protein